MKVEADGFSDRLLVEFGSSSTPILLRSPAGEAFRFTGYAFARVAGQSVIARGKLVGLRLRVNRDDISLTVNGEKAPAVVRHGFLVYGDTPEEGESAPSRSS